MNLEKSGGWNLTVFYWVVLHVAQSSGLPNAGDPWSDGMPTHVNNDGTTLVVSKGTNQYVDIMDKNLKREFDKVYRGDDPLNRYADPVGDASISIRILSGLASMICPISNNAPYAIYPNPNGVINDAMSVGDRYLIDLQIERIEYYSEYNIIY